MLGYRIEIAHDSLEHEAIIHKHKLNNGGMLATLDYDRGDYTAIAYAPDGKPVGAATILRNYRPHRFRHLAMCYVKRNHRRSAVGRQLIEALLTETGVDRGATYAYLGRFRTSGAFWEALGIFWSLMVLDLCFSKLEILEEYPVETWPSDVEEREASFKRELEYNAARLISQQTKSLERLGVKKVVRSSLEK